MLANLAMDFAAIHSAEYADVPRRRRARRSSSTRFPVGTGPFSFVTYQKDAVIRFKANKDYWGEKALVDDLVFAITPDPDRALLRSLRPASATSSSRRGPPTCPRCRRTRRSR